MAKTSAMPELVPIQDAADRLHVRRETLYRYAGEGRIELIKLRGRTFVTQSELDRFVSDNSTRFVPGARVVGQAS